MKEIGGFFELELPQKQEYHKNVMKLDKGASAFEYVLLSNNYKKVYLPYYICSCMLDPIIKNGICYEYYSLNEDFSPQLNLQKLGKDEVLLYVNYFAMCNDQIKGLVKMKSKFHFNLCIDNTQSFFSIPKYGIDTFNSCRKFFGVPDGAYLYTSEKLGRDLDYSITYDRCTHLLKRIDVGVKEAYPDYVDFENDIGDKCIGKMSRLSEKILSSIDYQKVMQLRWENFEFIHDELQSINKFRIEMNKMDCPMVYPLLMENGAELRKYLIEHGIFCAQYWSEVNDLVEESSWEYYLANHLVAIPIDQRYGVKEMEYILQTIKDFDSRNQKVQIL